jgi:hypothetical protein
MFYTLQGEVEAIKVNHVELTGDGFDGSMFTEMKDWLRALFLNKSLKLDHTGAYDYAVLVLSTDDGEFKLFPGDYIVRSADGTIHPVKAGFFNLLLKE